MGRGDVFRYAQSDVVLKHSDVLHLWCKVMLSLPFTALWVQHHCETTSLRSNFACRKANLAEKMIAYFAIIFSTSGQICGQNG